VTNSGIEANAVATMAGTTAQIERTSFVFIITSLSIA